MADEIKTIIAIEANLTKIQGQLGTLEGNFKSSFGRIEKLAGSALGAFGVGLGVGAVAGFINQVIDLGGQLADLNAQTGVSVQLLSGLKPVLERNGASMDTFAKGIFNLQKNLGSIDKATDPAAQAIKNLGLDVENLLNSSPDEFVRQITEALAKVPNIADRNTIAFNLLGKSAKELIPTIVEMAGKFDEIKSKGLSEATVKALDDIGDGFSDLKNTLLNFSAEPIVDTFKALNEAVIALSSTFNALGPSVDKSSESWISYKRFLDFVTFSTLQVYESTLKILRVAPLLAEALTFNTVDFNSAAWTKAIKDIEKQKNKVFNAPLARSGMAGAMVGAAGDINRVTAAFKGTGAAAAAAKNDVDNFLEGLQKQIASLQNKDVELTFGVDVALGKSLDAQLEQLKEKIRATGKDIPPGLDDFFKVLRDRIVNTTRANTELNESLEKGIKIREAMAAEANEGVGPQTTTSKDEHERNLQRLQQQLRATEQLRDLRRQLALETLPPEQREDAQRGFDLEERLDQIEKWRIDTINATQDIAAANADAAALAAQAWDAFYTKQKEKTDEQSEFMRRAFERGFDAVSDGIKDILDNGFKGINDFGEKVRKTLNSLAADFVTLQLKKAVLGEDFGKPGASVGGIIGDLFGTNKKTPTTPVGYGQRPPGVEGPMLPTGFFSQPAGMAKSATDQGAIVAIQTQASTGQAAISATQPTAVTGIQGAVTAGQGSINATQTAAVSGIDAVKVVAIAAINAAKGVPGNPLAPVQPLAPGTAAESSFTLAPNTDIFRNFPSPAGVPAIDTHEDFMREASAALDSVTADLEHAIATGGSLLSRSGPSALQPVGADMPELLVKVAAQSTNALAAVQSQTTIGQSAISATKSAAVTAIDTTAAGLSPATQQFSAAVAQFAAAQEKIPLSSPFDKGGQMGISQSPTDLESAFTLAPSTDSFRNFPSPFGVPTPAGADMPELLNKVATEGISSIQTAGDTAQQGIATTGALTKTGIDSLLGVALNALSAMIPGVGGALGGGGGSMGGIGGLFGSLFPSWKGLLFGGNAAPLATVGADGFYHEGGLVTPGGEHASFRSSSFNTSTLSRFHDGGPIMRGDTNTKSPLHPPFAKGEKGGFFPRLHDGGAVPKLQPGEVMIIAKHNEFMINDKSTAKVGKPALEYINRFGELPPLARADAQSASVQNVFNSKNRSDTNTFNTNTLSRFHQGGPITNTNTFHTSHALPKFHDGGAISIGAGRSITGRSAAMGNMPVANLQQAEGSRGHLSMEININSPDVDGFRRSQSQIEADIAGAVARGNQYR